MDMISSRIRGTALIEGNEHIGYDELRRRIHSFARLIPAGDNQRVALVAENRSEWVYAFYAAWYRKAVTVPMDYLSTVGELAYMFADCRPEVVFCSRKTEKAVREAAGEKGLLPKILVFEELSPPSADLEPVSVPVSDSQQPAVIIYTSGTTGSPKGVVLTFDNLLSNLEAVIGPHLVCTEEDRTMILLPLHHAFPLTTTLLVPLHAGATSVFCPALVSTKILNTLQQHGITIFVGVPRLFELIRKGVRDQIRRTTGGETFFRLAQMAGSRKVSRLLFGKVHRRFGGKIKYLVSGGAALDPEVARDFQTLGFTVIEGYGMSETAPFISFNRPGNIRLGSVGQAIPSASIRIRNDEIQVQGRNVMAGYLNRPEETAEVFEDGWLRTGDLGRLDKEGFLYITGRRKEIIVLPSGKNVNPVEIEQKLTRREEWIGEVGVFMDETILHALIVPAEEKLHLDREELEKRLREEVIEPYNRGVSSYKRIIKFTVVEEPLPRTRLNKLRRFKLPEVAEREARRRSLDRKPLERIQGIIGDYLMRLKEIRVHSEDRLTEDLGLDSLDQVSLLVFLEHSFGVKLQQADLQQYATVGRLVEHVAELKVREVVKEVSWSDILAESLDFQLPDRWFPRRLAHLGLRVLLKTLFRVRVRGLENLPAGPFILAANHQSILDGLLVPALMKPGQFKRTFLYARTKLYARWRVLTERSHIILVDLEHDLKNSLQKLGMVLRQGGNVVIFPEGTRSRDGSLGAFRRSFAILSRELDVPVVPVAIRGTFRALKPGRKVPRPGTTIELTFAPPVYPAERSYAELRDEVFREIRKLLESTQDVEF
jgi:long-chain acyl-CoA synthetase